MNIDTHFLLFIVHICTFFDPSSFKMCNIAKRHLSLFVIYFILFRRFVIVHSQGIFDNFYQSQGKQII